MKRIFSWTLQVFVFWLVTVASYIQFNGMTGNYNVDIVVNGVLYMVACLVFGLVITVPISVLFGFVGSMKDDSSAKSCACLAVIMCIPITMIANILFLTNVYKLFYFFPQYTLWQAFIIEFITTIISIAFSDYKKI